MTKIKALPMLVGKPFLSKARPHANAPETSVAVQYEEHRKCCGTSRCIATDI